MGRRRVPCRVRACGRGADNASRREKLTAELALRRRESAEEVFVDVAEHVLGLRFLVAQWDRADEVDQFAKAFRGDIAARVVGGEDAAQARVGAFDGVHGAIDHLGDVRLLGVVRAYSKNAFKQQLHNSLSCSALAA